MPIYEYECKDCGGFSVQRKMAERNNSQSCPHCEQEASRVMLTAPAFAGMPALSRVAHATNERAAHEPKSSKQHGKGCGCCSGAKSKKAPDGSSLPKAFPNKRPWMISH